MSGLRGFERPKETGSGESLENAIPGLRNLFLKLTLVFPTLCNRAIQAALGLPETEPSRPRPKDEEPPDWLGS
jgi:hypothetical protein